MSLVPSGVAERFADVNGVQLRLTAAFADRAPGAAR
jgi:hypothetical protein